ncbi:MAG: DUF885 family protein [Pseudomonadales bacterium]
MQEVRTSCVVALLSLLLWSCAPVSDTSQPNLPVAPTESERLNTWFAEKFEQELQSSPVALTFLGRKEQYDKIDDYSEQAEAEQLAWKQESVREMERLFDYDALSDEAKASYDIWKYQYEIAAAGSSFNQHDYIFEQMGGMQSFLPNFLLNFHKVEDEADLQAYIRRIAAVAQAIAQLQARAEKAAENGIRPPRFAYEGAIEQATNLLIGQPFDTESAEDSPLWAGSNTKISSLLDARKISDDAALDYQSQVKKALLQQFKPAYQTLIDWLRQDSARTTAQAQGAGSLPNGEAYYNHQLAASTTTSLSANEIHDIGLAEVERLRGDIEKVMNEVNFNGSLQDFFAHVRSDPQFFFPDTDEGRQGYIDGAEFYLAFIKKRLPDYFGLLPKADLVVKRVEAFREQDGAAQHYYAGTPDGSRPGIYYAHLSDMTAMPKNQMEVIAYHEGLPGHHMQISIAQELDSVPQFRTQASFTAYVEGWALYSEVLAGEMGAYEDPYSRVGQLSSEIWRAIRLVVDTGIHSKGWGEEQAVQYFMTNSPEPEESIRSEVRRYIVWPGQATSYKIGMLKILELRANARTALGTSFDIRAFHDRVLSGGALPLSVLERRVKEWISEELAADKASN